MKANTYKLFLEDGAYGPGDLNEVTIEDEGNIAGPKLPHWQAEYMLVRCLVPTSYRSQELEYLVLSSRHLGISLNDLRRDGGIVAVARVLPGAWHTTPSQFEAHQVQYWAVGRLVTIEGQ